jgi:hypothetical protein
MLRDFLLRFIKPLVRILLFAAMLSRAAVAQDVLHGTFFIFGISTDFAVVAIDSRGTIKGATRNRVNDRFCKIRPLSHNAFFFSAGLSALFQGRTGKIMFDARDVAEDVYASFGNSRDFGGMAEKWALRAESAFRKDSPAPSLLKDIVTRGYFVGIKDDGEIDAGAETITYHADTAQHFTHTLEHFVLAATPHVQQPIDKAALDVEQEFAHGGQTERAKKVIQDSEWATIGNGPDAVAVRFSNLVTAVRDWSGNDKVGGDIATIILERGKDWRWFHRPDFCPDKRSPEKQDSAKQNPQKQNSAKQADESSAGTNRTMSGEHCPADQSGQACLGR